MLRETDNERGAVALLVALLSTALFAAGALAVDLGNTFARRRDVQAQADFAALAGGAQMSRTNIAVASNAAVLTVADYLNRNRPQQDAAGGWSPVTPSQLVDGNRSNGEVEFGNDSSMTVWTPQATVNYGLARILGRSNTLVGAHASVQVRSGGGILPFFAVSGCDFGPQTISDPAPSGSGRALTDGSPPFWTNPALTSLNPTSVALNASPAPSLIVNGTSLTGTTQVGYFLNDGTTKVTQTPSSVSATAVSVTQVPSQVLATEQTWYVRLFNGTKWTDVDSALPLRVGSSVLECLGAASQGNFGSLILPRSDSNNSASGGWLPINIAQGLQAPLSLAPYPAPAPPYTCSDVPPSVVSTAANRQPGTNCLDTDTGLPDTSATAGFITGGSNGISYPGRLDAPTTPGCGAQAADRNARWDTGISMPGPGHVTYKVNDDLLTCFFTNSSNTINSISQGGYSGPPVLSPDIYKSPRFFFIPVLGTDPASGGSDKYEIVDFRAGFITDQPGTATKATNTLGTTTDHNGISVSSGKISKLKVVFFNANALPEPPDDATLSAYMGFGPKKVLLTN